MVIQCSFARHWAQPSENMELRKFTKKCGHIFLLSSLDEISNKIPSRQGNLPRFFSKHNRSQQAKLHVPPGKTNVLLFVCTEQLRCNSGAAISGHESIVVTFEVLTFFALGVLFFSRSWVFLWISMVPSWIFLYRKICSRKESAGSLPKKMGLTLFFAWFCWISRSPKSPVLRCL